jgi:uncharacterized protein YndB with AHSA1/START domain
MSTLQQGYLLIADITGYTMYLSQSELEHAQEVLQTLLELLIEHTRPPLIISRLAGDAVISYALPGGALQGQTFVEMVENTYIAFRRAIELMVLNNTCHCNACANVAALDLKFFIHFGTFAIQRLGGHDELVGSDVTLIHRLLKNHVTEQTGLRAYTLYTDAAIRQLGLADFCQKLRSHQETYEHLGMAELWLQDMHPVWQQKQATTHITIPPQRMTLQVEAEIAMPPELVWDYLSHPEFRSTLMGSDRQRLLNRTHGRIAPGSVFQCFHGDRVITQTILQWQPFEQMTSEDLTPIPRTYVLVDLRLVPTGHGTRLIQTFSKAKGPLLGRILCDIVMPMRANSVRQDVAAFQRQIEADLAARGGSPAGATISPEIITEAITASLIES